MSSSGEIARSRVPARVAKIVGRNAPRSLQLAAVRGELALTDIELLTVLVFLCQGADEDLRRQALGTMRSLPSATLQAAAADSHLPAQLLHFIARVHPDNLGVMETLVCNPATADVTLIGLARRADAALLQRIADQRQRLAECPDLMVALCSSSHADEELRRRLECGGGSQQGAAPHNGESPSAQGRVEEDKQTTGEEGPEEDQINFSKYQLSLDMPVAEKIKTALTGDKEWRTIMLRDANKLVSSAVLKNPRITDGEVLSVARNRSSHDELIRLVLLNNEWVKSPEIRKALVVHPRTPLPKALRFMSALFEKELKQLAKSRNVSQVIVNNARRMLAAREKKK
ncbi:hypothetical protein SAMN05660860_01464 [Geoalkalibacter ferrihydriticus]|uniref:Uncharacterized protein n=1 Tax=Geoalkalibacter ferrihydriticus TaxID=392333 RepID=A0A1G9P3A4_9BACT|nr:hypothetical protein [Geoalkalibacter ferrihydriticus]SDL93149.1 hypothetical protein SAMN05660860_01464 [Geoalkalibacter ferrihydriticus]